MDTSKADEGLMIIDNYRAWNECEKITSKHAETAKNRLTEWLKSADLETMAKVIDTINGEEIFKVLMRSDKTKAKELLKFLPYEWQKLYYQLLVHLDEQ